MPSLLWTDLYKLTMLQIFYFNEPKDTIAKYRFKCRNVEVTPKGSLLPYKEEIDKRLTALCGVKFTPKQIEYLATLPFFWSVFIIFLKGFQLDRKYLHIDESSGQLDIWAEGPLLQVMMWEIYVLQITHEVYSLNNYDKANIVRGDKNLTNKIQLINDYAKDNEFKFADFGARRALTADWHRHVVERLQNEISPDVFIGTSNLELAMDLDLTSIGTFAHEFPCYYQGIVHPLDSQKAALNAWGDLYKDKLMIALSDTLGLNKFLEDFNKDLANKYLSVRHDSGDPYMFTGRMLDHYKTFGIDPTTKTIVFSDGLDIPKAIALNDYCKGKIGCSFGIGTSLTNDCGVYALQNVMKLVAVNGRPVAKISDSTGKCMCEDEDYLKYLRKAIEIFVDM